MNQNWSGRRVRQVLKHWYYLDHNFGQLTFNDIKYMEQLYFRLSYLNSSEQLLLIRLFYYPLGQQPNMTHVVRKHHLDYVKFNYTVHKPERKLMKYRSSPNLSMTSVTNIQYRRLSDDFRSILTLLKKKFRAYPKVLQLDRIFDEDFGTVNRWPRTKVCRILKCWCRVERRLPKRRRKQVAAVRQLIFRLSYLPRINYQILRQYYYYPTRKQQRRVRSEHLAQDDGIYLGKLLLLRLHGLQALEVPRRLPKLTFTDDELWQIRNDQQEIQAIVKRLFKH